MIRASSVAAPRLLQLYHPTSHSGLLVSISNWTWSEIGCCSRTIVSRHTTNIDKGRKTHGVHTDPVLFGIVLSTRQLCDTLTLRRRYIVRFTFYLISRANCARETW